MKKNATSKQVNDGVRIPNCFSLLTVLLLSGLATAIADDTRKDQAPGGQAEPLPAAVTAEAIDAAATVEWVAGEVRALAGLAGGDWLGLPGAATGPKGFFFGAGAAGGPRHFRVGFTRDLPLGTVVTRGLGRLSILRPGVAYPGDPAREADWLPAERLRESQISVWILPPRTTTRALRWSAEGSPAAEACPDLWSMAPLPEGLVGWFGGLYAFPGRMMDVAPYAEIIPVTPGHDPHRLVDGEYRLWWGFGGNQMSWGGVWETHSEAWGASDDKPPIRIIYAWPSPVTVVSVGLCFPGVGQARVETFADSPDIHPREAPASAWVEAGGQSVRSRYPAGFDVEWLAMAKPTLTTAVRLDGTAPLKREDVASVAPDVAGRSGCSVAGMLRGRRVWLGNSIMLAPIGDRSPADVAAELTVARVHPPIPIRFTLKEPGYVTLVIEDAKGERVRNLVSETHFPAGENTVWWDGLDDHRAKNIRTHGAYEVDGRLVEPGEFRVRGLVRGQVDLRYEFSVYNPVNPPWRTADRKGQWLADHTPPSDVLFVPGEKPFMLIGGKMAEGSHGLVWTDLEGRKIIGTTALASWAGAGYLAYDPGPERNPSVDAYAAAIWRNTLHLRAIDGHSLRPVIDYKFPKEDPAGTEVNLGYGDSAGLAAYNGTLVVSVPRAGGLVVVDAAARKVTGTIPIADPRGVVFTADGTLLCVTSDRVLRLPPFEATELPPVSAARVLVGKGLEDAHGIALDAKGNLYVSDRGGSHQVKVFSPRGRFLRTVGRAGMPTDGPYDELRMNNPGGIAVTDEGHIWVAEEDFRPKRVSVWSPEGKLLFAKYGPSRYGGGGTIDPRDKSRFYYKGMEFKLDWEKGTDRLVSIYHRPNPVTMLHFQGRGSSYGAYRSPETPIYLGDRQYMVDAYNADPTRAPNVSGVWLMRDGRAHLVAAVGLANALEALQTPEILAVVPKTDETDRWGNNLMDITQPLKYGRDTPVTFAWSDLNGNGKIDPDEITFMAGSIGGLAITRDLTFVSSLTKVLSPARFTAEGVPVYDLERMRTLLPDARLSRTSGTDQVTLGTNGDIALTMPLERQPSHYGLAGVTAEGAAWYYPNKYHGLHASQTARPGRVPEPGELIGTTRVLGLPVVPGGGSDAGELWGINANSGVLYLFTTDGLFVASLFKNGWIAAHQGDRAVRGMLLNEASTEGESFWPSITQTADGKVYIVGVEHTSSIVHVDGLDSIRRLPPWRISVSPEDIEACRRYTVEAEAERVAAQGRGSLTVAMHDAPPVVDGDLDEWTDADWVVVDPGTRAAVAVAGDRLFVAYHTTHANLLNNSGDEPWQGIFKTGGGLDVMLGLDRPGNRSPAAGEGDLRLIVALVDGEPRAVLYRPVAAGTPAAERVPFSSPSRTIHIDRVTDISEEVSLALGQPGRARPPWAAPNATNVRNGTAIELSVPLKTLGLDPQPGLEIAGDLGILRGDGAHTTYRACWHNQATGLVQDVPGEAALQPTLWGRWMFQTRGDP